ncbi:unnamed protein product [Diatraea saccharalis]|uniref:RRM domain-containing protein n=1 Tax=Diatraea saccharalis TaxID=40085 RepID=A0A9P0C8F1_9NEOP|nr:unnamed protein product [Diatraea saccharalis]
MNSWGNEYGVRNQFNMPSTTPILPNMVSPLVPPMSMISEIAQFNQNPPSEIVIGPVISDTTSNNSNDVQIVEDTLEEKRAQSIEDSPESGRNHRSRYSRRDRYRDRSRRRSRSRDRYSRRDRSKSRSRDRSNRHSSRNERKHDRSSKWEKNDDNQVIAMNNLQMMTGMMPVMMNHNMMTLNMMGQQQPIDIGNMPNRNLMPMMPDMNMIPNIMESNMMMSQQMRNQPVVFSTGVLLPPIPGISLPNRREKPLGCRSIFVGGLPNGISENNITEIFQRFGLINNVKLHRQGVCHVRFNNHQSVEQSFLLSGYRFKLHEQTEKEATTIFVDYALNRDDQDEYEKNKYRRRPTPPRIEPFTPASLNKITEKIKNDEDFYEVAPTLLWWLDHGECTKKYANTFYSLIQAANNQVRRLFNDKMQVDEEFHTVKNTVKEKYLNIISQFEQVAKILTAAKHQRVSDLLTKQQRRNIDMWVKMTEEVDNIKEEYDLYFEDEEIEKVGNNVVPLEKYEALKKENENLIFELEGYKNEAHLAKDEAERKFEKFKAHFIAQQALQNPKQVYPPLPPPPMPPIIESINVPKPEPPPPTPDDIKLSYSDAKLISVLTAFLLVHPLGATLDYIVSYVRSMIPGVTHDAVNSVLQNYTDIFRRKTTGVGSNIEHKWEYVTFDAIKMSV